MNLQSCFYILVFLTSFYTSVYHTFAACDPACRATKYKYLGCDLTTNKAISVCTDNPRGISNFRPWKKCFPITVTVGNWPLESPGWYFDLNGDEIAQPNEIIFEIQQARTIIQNGFNAWGSTCTPDNQDCDNCPLEVKWVRREEDMKGHPNALAVTYQRLAPTAGTPTCKVDCSVSHIAINTTDNFLDYPFASSTPNNWFYTNRNGPISEVEWFDLQTTIEHEMGHWLGFDDGQEGCNIAYNGLMQTPIPPNTTRSISNQDRCMFEKLYCCTANPTSVDKEETINSISLSNSVRLSPNPFGAKIIIKGIHGEFAPFTLDVTTITGQNVYHAVYEEHTDDINIDASALPVGTYMVMLTTRSLPRKRLTAIVAKIE